MILRLVVSRLFYACATLLLISFVVFVANEALPGDIAARALGRESTAEARAAFRAQLNLDRPFLERYALWLGGAVRGDFGRSLITQELVVDAVLPRLQNTLILAGYALLIYIPLTLLIAVVAALNRSRAPDNIIAFVNLVALSMPEFVIGTLLIYVFAVAVRWFPVSARIQNAETWLEVLHTTTLPALTLVTVITAGSVRLLRDTLIDVLDSDYVRMATLKGLPRWRIVLFHALPNAAAPTLNLIALNLTYLIGGVVIVEQIFSFQGMGTLLVESVFLRDAPVIEAIVLIVSALYIAANVGADVLGVLLNPRLRSRL